jgi:hypothetical protein
MRILLKVPTRSRPSQVLKTLEAYSKLANHPEHIGVAISCDEDDTTMNKDLIRSEINQVTRRMAWRHVFYSNNRTKIEACNANMSEIDYLWEIVVLVSDDMIPQVKGYDDVIRNYMRAQYPETNGILWFNDGYQANKLNTLTIMGRRMYESFGYLYHPSYKSLFCDTELTDLCNTTLKSKTTYIPYCIIRHEHPGTGFAEKMDELYMKNQKYWMDDMYTYISRKTYTYDWSVLIPTIQGREQSLEKLLQSIRGKIARLAPDMRVEIKIDYDNCEKSIGAKREGLLQSAQGKYVSFIDDDDDITEDYIEDLWNCIQGDYHVMRLYGRIDPYRFFHTIEFKETDKMATDTTPPMFRRPPNHLNPMLTDVAKLVHFQDASRGEDMDWAIRLHKTRFLVREYRSDPSRTHYIYNLGTRTLTEDTMKFQQATTYETMLRAVFTPNGYTIVNEPPPPAPGPRVLRLGAKGFVSK